MNAPASPSKPPYHVFYVNGYGRPSFETLLRQAGPFLLHGITAETPEAQGCAILAQAHVYQVGSGTAEVPPRYLVRAELLERTPALLLVSTIGAGYDTVDVAECTRRGIAVVNQSGGANAQAVVEHTLAMMLALGKRMVEADRHTRREAGVQRHRFVGQNLLGRTLGLVGFGQVGRRLAALCAQGFGMRVLVHSEHASAQALQAAGAEAAPLDRVLAEADYVAVCCALTERTRGLIDAAAFARMKRGAYFVTTARGGIHDERALVEALRSGHLAGAGVDVWDVEPPPLDHPLLAMDNVIATPHIAGATVESREQAAACAVTQIAQAMRGERPANLLNPDVWPHFLRRLQQTFGPEVIAGTVGA
jgi:D-3-phosphoglycerate dehydrogenase